MQRYNHRAPRPVECARACDTARRRAGTDRVPREAMAAELAESRKGAVRAG